MKRLQRAVILAELADLMKKHDSWCGETHIQKAVYFLQELLNVPLEYGYILYKHGPFSFDLRDEITELRAYELFRLEPRPIPYGPSLATTQNAKKMKSLFLKTLNRYEKRLAFVAETLGDRGVADLERLATALYVTIEAKKGGNKARAERIHTLKPHVTIESALEAVKEVDEMRETAEKLVSEPA
jgi:uncharacterized protein YwgA